MAKFRQKIDASQVEDLALIGSTLSEMAIFLNCSEASLDRRFRKIIKRGMVRRMIFLRLALFARAVNGDATALKWFLAQPNEQLQDMERHEKEDIASLSDAELIERAIEIRDSFDQCLARGVDC
jgi:hypothetical protein